MSMPIRRNRVMTADVGDEIWLAPPRTARIAGPEPGQDGEDESQRQRNRHAFRERPTNIDDEGEQLLTHVTIASRSLFGFLVASASERACADAGLRYRGCALIRNESKSLSALRRGRFRVAAIAIFAVCAPETLCLLVAGGEYRFSAAAGWRSNRCRALLTTRRNLAETLGFRDWFNRIAMSRC